MDDTPPAPPIVEPTSPEGAAGLPWEDPRVGGLSGLLRTIGMFITRPDEAFSEMAPSGLGRPFFYAVLMAWAELIVGLAYWAAFQSPFLFMGVPKLRDELAHVAVGAGAMVVIGALVFILMPILVAIGLAINAAIIHLMLLIVGEGRRGFETTVRVICYSHTADLANIVPLCGGLLSLVWFVALQVIGISRAHRCSYGKAALAVFLPLLLCCSCLVVAISFWGAILIGALSDH
jgi:hypothetical protein